MAAFSIHHHYYHSLFSIQAHPKPSGCCLFYSSCCRSPTTKNRHKLPLLTKSFRNHHRSSPNSTTTTTTLSQQQGEKDKEEEESSRSRNSGEQLLRNVIKLDALGLEILSIALPAALALLADPLTSLVDTAFVGHLGSVELAAVGVSVSVFSLVSKLFNVPLLNITTSFVAQEQAATGKDSDESTVPDDVSDHKGKITLPSISTSLALATGLGIAETFVLCLGSGFLMNTMGIAVDSPMRMPAEQFLTLRAFGAPPIVIALAAQGTFRGFKDTRTPLYAVGAGNILNVILDLILIFFFNLGIAGAAVATVTSEYVNDVVKHTEVAAELKCLTALILLWKLNDKVELITPKFDWGRVAQYLKSGALLIARTIGVLVTTTLATSMAAREGAVNMAGYQICFEVWLAVSLLTDALALAGQALLATDYSQGSYDEARKVVYKVLQIGAVTGVGFGAILFLGFEALSSLFTVDSDVLEIARSGTLFVAGSQPINAVAFVLDGLYYGVSDFEYAAYSTVAIGGLSVVFMLVATYFWGLTGVWAGLFFFMSLRVFAGILRLGSGGGPWKFLRVDMDGDA